MSHLRIALFCVPILLAVPVASAQSQASPQLAESGELTAKVVQLYRAGKFEEALPLAKKALSLAENAVGKNDSHLFALLINLGDLYVATVDYDAAKSSFARALTIAQANFKSDDVRIARPLDELALVAALKGDYKGSAEFYLRSLEIKSKALKPDDVEIARANFSLADAFSKAHDFEKATDYYKEAVRLYDQLGESYNTELVQVLRRYLVVLLTQEKKDEAVAVQTRLTKLSGETGVIEGGVLNGSAVKLVQPPYPPVARAANASGQVAVVVVIDETGKVISAFAISGHPLLQAAAIAAAKASKFTPTLLSGAPVKVRGTIIYNFVAW